mgnify:CR=1 FL=1
MALPLENGVVRLTAVLVTGAFCLIGAGATGLDGSLPLFLVLVALAAALYLAGPPLADTPLARLDRPGALEDLWAGPAVAAAVVLPFLGASPGEVRALGGLLGCQSGRRRLQLLTDLVAGAAVPIHRRP